MAILLEHYEHLWKDLLIRKGNQIDSKLNEYIKDMEFEIPEENIYKAKWLLYRLDQDIRGFMFKYFEVIEKSMISIINHKDKDYLNKITNEGIKIDMRARYCATINKCKSSKPCPFELELKKKSIEKKIINAKFIKQIQKQMNIFQGGVYIPNMNKFNDQINFRNNVQHFEFVLMDILLKKRKTFNEFFKIFNLHYKHSFALNFLSRILKRFTTDFDDIAIGILDKYTNIFTYVEDIYKKPDYKKLIKDYPEIKEYKLPEESFLSDTYKLFNDPNKGSDLYKERKELAIRIADYTNNYINYNTIKYRLKTFKPNMDY